MFKNFFNTALRTLLKHRSYTVINVLGLTLGITGAILIFLLTKFHLSFDTYHAKADRIYRIVTEFHFDGVSHSPGVPRPSAGALRNDFPQLEQVTMVQGGNDATVLVPNPANPSTPKKFKEEEGALCYIEPNYFKVFDYQLLKGEYSTGLKQPNNVVITQDIAEKYFGTADPIGKTFRIDAKVDLKVIGLIANIPNNTDQRYKIFASWDTQKFKTSFAEDMKHWGSVSSNTHCFLVLPPNYAVEQLQKQLLPYRKKYHGNDYQTYNYILQALKERHFDSRFDGNISFEILIGLSLVGLFLIITACINFVNLATAQALKRSKEIGVRKVLGSTKSQLFWQFIVETACITTISVICAIICAKLAFAPVNDWFDDLSGYQMSFSALFDAQTILIIICLTIVIIIFSGFYPAIVLAGFNPIVAIKGKVSTQNVGGISVRKGLVVAQFMISQVLIIFMIVIGSQMSYFKQADLGFHHEAIVTIPLPTNEKNKTETLKNEVARIADVNQLSLQFTAPSSNSNNTTNFRFDTRQIDEKFQVNTKVGDVNYAKLYDLKFVAGKNFAPSDTMREVIVNETLVKKLGVKKPEAVIGKRLQIWGNWMLIVGVLKDFHVTSLKDQIDPIAIFSRADNYTSMAVKINLSHTNTTMQAIEKYWNTAYPDYVFEYEFLDKRLSEFYNLEEAILTLIRVFSAIAIIIGCLGLYGLVSFMVTQKTKEIGVRKVLGASLSHILWLFGKEFAKLIGIAFLIAAPLGGWIMHNWLQDFTYRISLSVDVFVYAIAITAGIACITVGYQSIRAALANPVKALKSE
ncbi:ABC transporter permease [Flectobacillus major]|uniref:ABC transporter permease n=1 Tax=Flectobacillus major TaxID=103 RepID=UPI0004013F5C|nr:ABC transporter permease [Flectobacillus major]